MMMIALPVCLKLMQCQWTIESVDYQSFEIEFEAPFTARVNYLVNFEFDTIAPNSTPLKHPPAVLIVRIILLLPMVLKSNLRTINSSKYATDEIIETMFIPSRPPEVSTCISMRKCIVRFETESSRGSRISSRILTMLSLPNASTKNYNVHAYITIPTIECVACQETKTKYKNPWWHLAE